MTFTETRIAGVWIIQSDVFPDERGEFVRAWVPDEFRAHGLVTDIAQCSLASNVKRGTIRGLHYQTEPYEEVKVVRAVMGEVCDVAVDLRPDSRRRTNRTISAASGGTTPPSVSSGRSGDLPESTHGTRATPT